MIKHNQRQYNNTFYVVFQVFLNRGGFLNTVGIIAEFNPLHKGHQYLINKAKSNSAVICVLSGNFVQRGDTAFAEKRIRTEAALRSGVDLVVELPVLWSMSTAENFALGSVSILKNLGCKGIIFGSELGDLSPLCNAADILLSEDFSNKLTKALKTGITFACARELAATECGVETEILSKPNNILGIEYIKAAKKLDYKVQFETLKRMGSNHDSKQNSEFVSAALLREKLLTGQRKFCYEYISPSVLELFDDCNISDLKRIENGILAVLRTKALKDLEILPDISEGVENKLYSAIKNADTLDYLYQEIKVKRYTLARIRRLVLSAFIGADNTFFMKTPPYIRILGFNQTGENLLKTSALFSQVPIVSRWADIKALGRDALKVFETECRATDLFGLSLPTPLPCGLEYTSKIIKKIQKVDV